MEFTVPQFIEREPKIFGPFGFKQFTYIGIAGGIAIFLYFILPFPVFLMIAVILVSGAFILAFVKINGIPLPTVIQNGFVFLTRPRIYLWRKKTVFTKVVEKTKESKKEEKRKESPLKVVEKSYLKNLFIDLETKTK